MAKPLTLMGYPGIPTHFRIGGGLTPAPEILEQAATKHAEEVGELDIAHAWSGLSDDDRRANVELQVEDSNTLAAANAAGEQSDVTATLVDNAGLTLWGDLIDAALTEVKALEKPWPMMVEHEQRDVLERITKRVKAAGLNVVRTLASRGQASIICELESVTVKKGAKATLDIPKSALDQDLLDAVGGQVMLVVADFEQIKAIEAPKPEPDQADLLGSTLVGGSTLPPSDGNGGGEPDNGLAQHSDPND